MESSGVAGIFIAKIIYSIKIQKDNGFNLLLSPNRSLDLTTAVLKVEI